MFSFVYKHRYPSDHLGTRWWCGQGTMGWGGSRAVARLLALCLFLKAALPLCGTSPCSSFLWPILWISVVQIPEGTCLNDLSGCHCPYWAEPGLRSCWSACWWAPLGSVPVAPIQRVAISTFLPPLLWVRSCDNQKGSSPVCSVPGVVLGLMDIC